MSLAQNAYIDASNVYESSLENNYKKDNDVSVWYGKALVKRF